jgi:hypothetical protein
VARQRVSSHGRFGWLPFARRQYDPTAILAYDWLIVRGRFAGGPFLTNDLAILFPSGNVQGRAVYSQIQLISSVIRLRGSGVNVRAHIDILQRVLAGF